MMLKCRSMSNISRSLLSTSEPVSGDEVEIWCDVIKGESLLVFVSNNIAHVLNFIQSVTRLL